MPRVHRHTSGHTLPPPLPAAQRTTPSASICYSLAVGLECARLEREHELERAPLEWEHELERACLEQERLVKEKEEAEIRAKQAAEKLALKRAQENPRERQEKELAIKKAQEEARTAQLKQEADQHKRHDNVVNKAKQKRPVPKPSSNDTRSKRKGRSESRDRIGSTKKRKLQQETVSGTFHRFSGPLQEVEQNPPECFRRYVDGVVPTELPKDEESDMYVMSLSQWNRASPVDLDKILGTGCDVFVEDLLIPGKSLPPGIALRLRHNRDAEMEVQVPGLRFLPPDSEVEKRYPNSLRKTTLPLSPNSLTGSGLDLEDIAFRQTNGHWDKAPTRVTVEGPGAKLWIKRRTNFHREAKWFRHEVEDSRLLENWDPDEPDISTRQYEGVILLPRSGTLFMQSKEHIVVGIAPISSNIPTDPSDDSDKFTLVTGGHFLSASTTIPSVCMLLHLALLINAATNVEHDVMWRTFVRICAFWMDVSMDRCSDIPFNEAYLPRFSDVDATGWMDIVSIASFVVLSISLDGRHYLDLLPQVEASQRAFVRDLYRKWSEWFAARFEGYKDDAQIDWEQDVFTAVLLHLAVVLIRYHERERYQDGTGPDVLLGQCHETLVAELQDALDLYREGLGETLVSELNKGEPESWYFFKYKGPEITICRT
ncbi:hypothetical protein K438DRAFT_1852255 [Mycena galopus ATCC 62051]|nr:hypothetical protein K438DRAFT_1852255 [Mycena galopus ATCC 62051]